VDPLEFTKKIFLYLTTRSKPDSGNHNEFRLEIILIDNVDTTGIFEFSLEAEQRTTRCDTKLIAASQTHMSRHSHASPWVKVQSYQIFKVIPIIHLRLFLGKSCNFQTNSASYREVNWTSWKCQAVNLSKVLQTLKTLCKLQRSFVKFSEDFRTSETMGTYGKISYLKRYLATICIIIRYEFQEHSSIIQWSSANIREVIQIPFKLSKL